MGPLLSISSHFSTRGSQVRCKLTNYVSKFKNLGVNFATKFSSAFQCLNYCKQMFIVQVEINKFNGKFNGKFLVQWATKKVCISLNWLLLLSMNICLQTKFKH